MPRSARRRLGHRCAAGNGRRPRQNRRAPARAFSKGHVVAAAAIGIGAFACGLILASTTGKPAGGPAQHGHRRPLRVGIHQSASGKPRGPAEDGADGRLIPGAVGWHADSAINAEKPWAAEIFIFNGLVHSGPFAAGQRRLGQVPVGNDPYQENPPPTNVRRAKMRLLSAGFMAARAERKFSSTLLDTGFVLPFTAASSLRQAFQRRPRRAGARSRTARGWSSARCRSRTTSAIEIRSPELIFCSYSCARRDHMARLTRRLALERFHRLRHDVGRAERAHADLGSLCRGHAQRHLVLFRRRSRRVPA